MKYKVVIFDLFGTLVANFSYTEHERILKKMASMLSVPSEAFIHLTVNTFYDRAIGKYPNTESYIRYACKTLGARPQESAIKLAVQIRSDFELKSVNPREGAIETLTQIRSMGYKIGLISNCTSETPALWMKTPFVSLIDIPIFSAAVGFMKPDPQIYQLACELLKVSPQDCLFVSDGSNQELTGATQVGMKAVHIRIPNEDESDSYQIDVENWKGTTISDLKEISKFLV